MAAPITSVPTKASLDQISLVNWTTHLKGNINFFIDQGANLVAATTLADFTNKFHKITGATTIRNFASANGKAGQQATLYFTSALTIEHNGGGAGNIRVGGSNISVAADEVCTFVFDGTYWWLTGRSRASGTNYTKTTEKDVVSTAAETDLLNGEITIGAGVLAATGAIRITAGGDYLNNSGASRTLQMKLKLGATTLWDSGASNSLEASATRHGWHFTALIQALGATNAQRGSGFFAMNDHSAATTGSGKLTDPLSDSAAVLLYAPFLTGASAVDMTAAQALVLSATHSASNASLSIRLEYARIETLT
jgi:hypothetical protein